MISTKFKIICCICIYGVITFCINCRKESAAEVVIYNNAFETADLSNISNGVIETFNGTNVLGRYNNSYFELNLHNLPNHHLIQISFDLYIHDTWDGNANYGNDYNGPDIWQMSIDSNVFINTTFSNLSCPVGYYCPPQSYPGTYPSTHNPREGAFSFTLPGACQQKNLPDGTTLYKINKTFNHSAASLILKCLDHLKDKDAADPKCSESWSVDNLKVSAIK